MAPDHEARSRAFYDHENDEPRGRRRAAADWGVGDDIFDRMPSRRFKRADRRAEHHDDGEGRRFERRDEVMIRRGDAAAPLGRDERPAVARDERHSAVSAAVAPRQERSGAVVTAVSARGDAAVALGDERAGSTRAEARRSATSRDARAEARAIMSWGADLDDDEAPLVRGESRTIVLSRDDTPRTDADRIADALANTYRGERAGIMARDVTDTSDYAAVAARGAGDTDEFAAVGAGAARRAGETSEFAALPEAPAPRRTIKISGYPDRLPAPREQRRPRSAVERIGASPDRIVAYAVALGFLLVLIAVLTTGQ